MCIGTKKRLYCAEAIYEFHFYNPILIDCLKTLKILYQDKLFYKIMFELLDNNKSILQHARYRK